VRGARDVEFITSEKQIEINRRSKRNRVQHAKRHSVKMDTFSPSFTPGPQSLSLSLLPPNTGRSKRERKSFLFASSKTIYKLQEEIFHATLCPFIFMTGLRYSNIFFFFLTMRAKVQETSKLVCELDLMFNKIDMSLLILNFESGEKIYNLIM